MISWLFEISTYKYSTKAVTFGGDNYVARIIPDSFDGIIERWDISGSNLISPGEIAFEIDNADDTLSAATFQDEEVTIRLIVNSVETRTWKYVITHEPIEYYGKIKCYAEDFLQAYLDGDYPNTPDPKEIWSSDDDDPNDGYCIPVVLGTAYIPVRSVNTGSERFYVLGESGPTYTVSEVRSPTGWPSQSTWAAASYDMDGYINSGYQLLQPIIADSTGDGNADAPGLWRNGNKFFDMLCRYYRSDTSSLTGPEEWIEYLLEDFGVDSGDIDATSFSAAGTVYTGQTVGFDGGGWWQKENREKILSNILAHVDSYLVRTDKIELYQFDKTSVETFDNVLSMSFSPNKITKHKSDSGRVHWPEAYDKPHSVLNGKAIVSTYEGGPTDSPSSTILEARFFPGESINAQKAGILYFQKRLGQKTSISFSVSLLDVTTKDSLHPGQVITVNNTLYGGSRDIIVTELSIKRDLEVNITGIELYNLNDWADLTTTTTKSVVTDASNGWTLGETDYNGDLGAEADWDTLLNIPDRFKDTASLGVNVTSSYLGYYDGADFQSYIDSNGLFQFRGDANNYINWNGATLNVVGSITVKNPSDVRTAINVADGADVTGSNTSADTSAVNGVASSTISGWRYGSTTYIDGGDIYTNTVTAAKINVSTLSAISANVGTITAGLIRSDNWGSSSGFQIDLSNAAFEIREVDGLVVSSTAGIKIDDGGELRFYDGATQTGIIKSWYPTANGILVRGTNGGLAGIECYQDSTNYTTVAAGPDGGVGLYLGSRNQGCLQIYFPDDPDAIMNINLYPTSTSQEIGSPWYPWNSITTKGIDFLDTTLSTYIEGSWTPRIAFGGGSSGVSYHSDNGGYYVRVGRIVMIVGVLRLSNKGSSSGNAAITNLPYTNTNNISARTTLNFGYISGVSNGGPIGAYIEYNQNYAGMYYYNQTGGVANITNTHFSTASNIIFGATYRV